VRLFISHANADLHLAQVLRVRLEEVSEDLNCSLLADDVFGGEVWEERIRDAAHECDGILSLVTSRYVERPWFVAEWALFWFQDKPWYLFVDDVDVAHVFEPMRRRQASRLDDRRAVERFLRALPVELSAGRPLDVIASELVKAIAEERATAARASLEANLAQFAVSLKRGTKDVSESTVDEIVRAGGLASAVELAHRSDNSVALRQFAAILLQRDLVPEAQAIADDIPNNAERRSVGLVGLDRLAEDPSRSDVEALVQRTYESVRDPQRRDLREGAVRRGVHITWPDLPANP
jgi:hypothetical protein